MPELILQAIACLPFAIPLIQAAPHLDGDTVRQMERASEARAWLLLIERGSA